jgi:branched-chain amino acid aminotransferase
MSRLFISSFAVKRSIGYRHFSSSRMAWLAGIDSSKLSITKTTSPKTFPPPEELVFGKTFTDYMLTVEWTEEEGWGKPEIKPYQDLHLDPAAAVLHYSFECFEGLKALKGEDGVVRIFRPDKNMARMNKSGARICLPTFEGEEMIKLLKTFVDLERDSIPQKKGYSLYLRPTFIATNSELGVKHPSKALLYVIACPVGPYYSGGFKAVRLEASNEKVRAWPGGVGDSKLGANYAPTVLPQKTAASKGYDQILWLFGEEDLVTEAGTMNAFFAFKDSNGKKELVTAPLDGTILEGVTRDSILELAKQRLDPNEWTVNERYFSMKEVVDRAQKGELLEAFGAGTAAIISPIKEIGFNGNSINVPLQDGKEAGPIAESVHKWLTDIQYGVEKHDWAVVVA